MTKVIPFVTKDGSSTLFSKHYNQYYHNPNGALAESQTVFIKRLNIDDYLKAHNGELMIFEMGFGTGLNFLLAAQAFLKSFSNLQNTGSTALQANKPHKADKQAKPDKADKAAL